MARMRGPRFKKCRRLGLNVCGHPKAMNRVTENRRGKKMSPYGTQLLEKQRLRGYYEVMEKQFRNYVQKATKKEGIAGTNLIQALECRLDNLVYRLKFGTSIRQARQLVNHGHIMVNGKKADIASMHVSVGDVISLKEKSKGVALFKENFLENISYEYPYLSKDESSLSGTLTQIPERDEVPIDVDDYLVIEYYARLI